MFFDRNQYILKNQMPSWLEQAGHPLVLNKNCRNTAEVFKTSCGFVGIEGITHNDVHGEVPAVRLYHNSEELDDIVDGFISRVIQGGLSPYDIVILTTKTVYTSSIDIRKRYGGQKLSTDKEIGKILFTSIRKFKGLEAEAVLIADSSISELELPENRRLLYVGSSRAKNLLNIALLADVESKETDRFVKGIAQGNIF